jgi:hypothetical protein
LCCFVVASCLSAVAQQSLNASHPSASGAHAACCSKPWCVCSLLLLQPASVCRCVFVYHVFIAAYRMFCAIAATALFLLPGRARGGSVLALQLCVLRYDACAAGVCACWMCPWMHCYQCQHVCASFACLFAYRYVCVTTAVWSAYCKVLAGASLTASRFLPPNSPGTRACAYASIPRLRCSSVSLHAVRLAGTSLR